MSQYTSYSHAQKTGVVSSGVLVAVGLFGVTSSISLAAIDPQEHATTMIILLLMSLCNIVAGFYVVVFSIEPDYEDEEEDPPKMQPVDVFVRHEFQIPDVNFNTRITSETQEFGDGDLGGQRTPIHNGSEEHHVIENDDDDANADDMFFQQPTYA